MTTTTARVLGPGRTVEVFFDGACPLCMREIRMLRRRDHHARIEFTDIAAPGFDARALGTDQAALMARIHGRLADGTWIEGVEVFRQLYAAVGFRRLVAISRWPGIAQLAQLGYHLFARNRLRLTGRCVDDACAIPPPRPTGGRAAATAPNMN
jgi:predicted DCC family thiol-disulfide oxidoreductase YuxK